MSDKFNELDKPIINQQDYRDKAIDIVMTNYEDHSFNMKGNIEKLKFQIREQYYSYNKIIEGDFDAFNKQNNIGTSDYEISLVEISNDIKSSLKSEIQNHQESLINDLEKLYIDNLNKLKSNVKKLKFRRARKYILRVGGTFILISLVYIFLVKFSSVKMPTSLLANIIIGLICSTIPSFIFFILTNKYDNYNTELQKINDEFSNTISDDSISIVKSITNIPSDIKSEFTTKISQYIEENFNYFFSKIIDKNNLRLVSDKYDKIFETINNVKKTLLNYHLKLIPFLNTIREYYENSDTNIKKLEGLSDEIKNISIEPNF